MRRLLFTTLAVAVVLTQAAVAARPLRTAIAGESSYSGPDAGLALTRTRAAGATAVRLMLDWRQVAPAGTEKPVPFNASDPADPAYHWAAFDRQVRLAKAHGLDVIAFVADAPLWAQQANPSPDGGTGSYRPSALELGRFAAAAARRYSGSFGGLPRIRYWQAWNEPNASTYLVPQVVNGNLLSAAWYRGMLNQFAASVHAVHGDNSVIVGGLSPFTIETGSTIAVGPLRFMRALLCMSGGVNPKPTCSTRVNFDIWSTHPYTSGDPSHHAANPNDVSLGDLPKMRRLLDAAVKAHHVASRQRIRFWVTEFSWDTNPPDRYHAVPLALHARWVAEALYRMWSAGVDLVAWYLLRDEPYPSDFRQSGLYFRGGARVSSDRAKPSLAAFRFPFVAYKEANQIRVWGRTPTSRAADVIVERGQAARWTRLGVLRADRYGIVNGRVRVAGTGGFVRARLANGKGVSLGFSLTRPKDRFVLPFGGGGAGSATG